MPIATDITLNEANHVYTDSKGIVYRSASNIIGKYKAPFEKDKIAAKQAAKTGESTEDIIAQWDSAAPYGTSVHKQMEDYFLRKDSETDLIEPYLPILEKWRKFDYKFHPEVILCIRELRIAGTADMLVERDDDTWSILDWKTNKRIRKQGFFGKTMERPLWHLPDCNFIHYSL